MSLSFTVAITKTTGRSQNTKRSPEFTRRHTEGRREVKERKPFCKCCFDANKSEAEYTSHYLKDKPGPEGKVVCPTLLATECRYCHGLGHYKSHCPILSERKNASANTRRPVNIHRPTRVASLISDDIFAKIKAAEANVTFRESRAKEQTKGKISHRNAFAALADDDEEEVKVSAIPRIAVPKLTQGRWATPLDTSKQPSDNELFALKRAYTVTPEKPLVAQIQSLQQSTPIIEPKINWADEAESDSELEEDEEGESVMYDEYGRLLVDNSAW